METKICTRCKQEKSIDSFRENKEGVHKGYIIAKCKDCEKIYSKERSLKKAYPNISDRVVKDLDGEIWVDIIEEGFNGIYKVSNYGRVKSTPAYKRKIEKILKPVKREYYVHIFCLNGVQKVFYKHRIIAKAFIPNPENKPHINHINSNKHDNRIENLEWCTQKENTVHAMLNDKMQRGEDRYNSVLTECQVLEIFKSDKTRKELKKIYGIGTKHVKAIQTGKIWKWLTQKL